MKKIYYFVLVALLGINLHAIAQTYQSQNMMRLSNWFDPAVVAEASYGIKYNGIWGYTDSLGNEYAIMGSTAGTYFINVTNPYSPAQNAFVASRRDSCIWHEIKTYQNYCYIVSDDAKPNSFQIVDMSYLPDSVHVVYDSDSLFATSHTIFVDGNKLYCGYVRDGSVGYSAMAVFDLSNPASPVLLRKVEDDYPSIFPYAHDMFVRNDTIYASCGYYGLYIFKLDASNHFQLLNSITTYPGQGYNHSSALSDDGHTLIFCEELPDGQPVRSLDVTNLSNPTFLASFQSHVGATPHNPFIKGNLCYISYYQDGLQVYDISNPAIPVLVAYFDTHWQNDSAGNYPSPADAGAWGAYPWLPSGNIVVSDMQNGLYVLNGSANASVTSFNNDEQLFIYPNPSNSDYLNVRLPSSIMNNSVQFELLNMQGQVVQKNRLTDNRINVATLSSGIYTLRFKGENFITTQKFTRIK